MASSISNVLRRTPIPEDLSSLVSERRVIPFVGAGFSAGLGLPGWEALLRKLSEELDPDLPFGELSRMANRDYMQIAEYLFIKAGKRIGPIRHVIESTLASSSPEKHSGAHVELANLGAPQVYTTNYDDLIERAYQRLQLPYSVVALPKDVANFDNEKTQIVKYHGDLRHESSLVLTESAYYRRLDLESPMDLKFRSDILGRSVLFMGYSFRDVNIRLIWFKLMQMMQDIAPEDRRASYIVKIGPNPVQDALFRDVGLKPITLDPQGELPESEWSALLGEFLYNLASSTGTGALESDIPGTTDPMFVSEVLLGRLPAFDGSEPVPGAFYTLGGRAGIGSDRYPMRQLLTRRIPNDLEPAVRGRLLDLIKNRALTADLIGNLASKATLIAPSADFTDWTISVLRGTGFVDGQATRRALMKAMDFPWHLVWAESWTPARAKLLVNALHGEIQYNSNGNTDDDIVFLAYLVRRALASLPDDESVQRVGSNQLDLAYAFYPGLANVDITTDGRPPLDELLEEVALKKAQLEARADESNDADESSFPWEWQSGRQTDLFAEAEPEPAPEH